MKIITRMLEDEVYEAANSYGNTVSVDMRKSPLKQGQSPVELVLSALAACGAVDIVSMLKKRRKTIHDFVIKTEGVRRTETPRGFTNIHCRYSITSPDVNEEELYKISKLALEKYCSVHNSLKAEITFSVHVNRPA